ncbi:ferredoxin [Actinomadura rugatobispora]|uniref:Ferredoxin n=1 Tax=Actinomadura rugatobispora TaxID=1994 RepID=A0ABW1A4W2_9ACTN|nr:hypothetical protein GCM10010200_107410 [Actinomadura rugatobispora]
MKVRIDSERCQGHGRCYDLAPELFGDDKEGYGTVLADGVVPPDAAHAAGGVQLPRTRDRPRRGGVR